MIRRLSFIALSVILVFIVSPLFIYSYCGKNEVIPSDITSEAANLSADQIAIKAIERTNLRDSQFKHYSVIRRYEVKTEDKDTPSIINAKMTYNSPPAAKVFKVISKTNCGRISNLAYEHAIKIEKESLNSKNDKSGTISPENYRIALAGTETVMGIQCYVLELTPRRNDGMLIKGRIWISVDNFDTLRIEGSPVKSPSVLIRKISIVRQFQNINGFWLPKEDDSTVDVRVFGRVSVQIEHQNYEIRK